MSVWDLSAVHGGWRRVRTDLLRPAQGDYSGQEPELGLQMSSYLSLLSLALLARIVNLALALCAIPLNGCSANTVQYSPAQYLQDEWLV